jgi:WD40 repeat protein
MRLLKVGLYVFVFCIFCIAIVSAETLQFKAKLGFVNSEDNIQDYRFLEDGKKLILIGEKQIQLWDVDNAKLLNSIPHQIEAFAPVKFSDFFNLKKLFSWGNVIIDPKGKWVATVEKVGEKKTNSVVFRDLQTIKEFKTLDLPTFSVKDLLYEPKDKKIFVIGSKDGDQELVILDNETLETKHSIAINQYKWHQFVQNEEKLVVGSGETKLNWGYDTSKQGGSLSLRDSKTGKIEKEFTAQNLIPRSYFQETNISKDEKILTAKRDNRFYVWEIDGNGMPKLEFPDKSQNGEAKLIEIVGNRFVFFSINKKLIGYDIEKGEKPIFELSPSNEKSNPKFVNVIGSQFVLISENKKLLVFDILGSKTPKFEIVSSKINDSINYVDSSKDERFIVVEDDTKLLVFEPTRSEKPVFEIARDSEKERFPVRRVLQNEKYLVVVRANRSEKKPVRTEFYDLETGKIALNIPLGFGDDVKFTPNKAIITSEGLGVASFWNISLQKRFVIPLEVYSKTCEAEEIGCQSETYNTESVSLSRNQRLALRFGENITAVYDLESGIEIMTLVNPSTAKYDKKNRLKNSGLGFAGWSPDGKYVFAFDQKGFWQNRQTVSFWEVVK